MRKRMIALGAAVTLAVGLLPFAATSATASHPTAYCNAYDGRSTLIELVTPDARNGFYIHDRTSFPPGFGLFNPLDDHNGGTWMFMENGVKPKLQTGGEAIVFILNETGSDDECTDQGAASDPVIF